MHDLPAQACQLMLCATCDSQEVCIPAFTMQLTVLSAWRFLQLQSHASCSCLNNHSVVQDAEWHLTNEVKDIYPDFVKMADSFSVPAKRVLKPEELRPAIRYIKQCCLNTCLYEIVAMHD